MKTVQRLCPGSLLLGCWACVVLLQTLSSPSHATEVIRFDQNGQSENDNIYDILEDEQLFIMDKKLSISRPQLQQPKAKPSITINASSISNIRSSLQQPAAKKDSVNKYVDEVLKNTKTRTSAAPGMRVTSASVVRDEALADELMGDLLLFDEDRERLENAESERVAAEADLARRVRRQATQEGSASNSVEGELTISLSFDNAFLNPSSAAAIALSNEALSILQTLFNQLPSSVTITITGFRSGSTVIIFLVDFGVDSVDRAAMATLLLSLRTSGFLYNGTTYDVIIDPVLRDGTANDTLTPATCFTCRSYQACIQRTGTTEWACQTSSSVFLPFGFNQGDSTMQKNKKKLSIVEKVPTGIPIAGDLATKVALSMNGLMSFGVKKVKFNSFSPRPLPRGTKTLLCGYWSAMLLDSADTRSNVWYQAYHRTDSNTAQQSDMLARGKDIVQLYRGVANFSATFMLVATFEEIPPDASATTSDERVNFQMVLITNGQATYGLVTYAQGGMLWNPLVNYPVVIGYLEDNLDIDKYTPDTVIGNTNIRGMFLWDLGSLAEEATNPAQLCLDWYYANLPSQSQYQTLNNLLFPCPCDWRMALWSNTLAVDYTVDNTVCFLTTPFNVPFAKRCCYSEFSFGSRTFVAFEQSIPNAGSFLLHHPQTDPSGSYQDDVLPKQWCCQDSENCHRYYEVRPIGLCLPNRVIIVALTSGDPHIQTLDGRGFAFNPIGEFTLLKIDQPSLQAEVQGRACQAVSSTGEPVAASVFCAIVAKGNNSDILQVELSRSKDAMLVYVNGQDMTQAFNTSGDSFLKTAGELTVRRTNNTLRATFLEGVSINITVQFQLLTTAIALDGIMSTPVGLLGNMNGNPNDDFIFPNGTVLPNTTSEQDLLEYGKTWAVTNASTLFTYPEGFSTASFTNDSFVPIFLSTVNATRLAEAQSTCGGPENIGCVYDLVATNDQALALGTKDASDTVEENKKTAANTVPEVSGPIVVQVTNDQEFQFAFNASDQEDSSTPTYVIVNQPSSNFTFDNATQTARWTPSSNQTERLEVVVEDSTGAQSPAFKVEILRCSGCNNRGSCDFTETRPQTVVDQYYKEAVCVCEVYYSGDDCENDSDACEDEPCPLLTTCTDLTIAEHIAAGVNSSGYNCSDCPTGFTLQVVDNTPNCYDIDECNTTSPCNQTCTNTQGSFTCSCSTGYRLDAANKVDCLDIDECQENTANCEQVCVNSVGGFTCDCLEGFTLNATSGNTCVKDPATDPCLSLANSCSYACRNDSGSAVCVCPTGYSLTANQTGCEDIDECSLNQCSQECTNTDGAFTCSCYAGYQLDDDKITCNPCTGSQYGVNCASTCECRGRGTCNNVRGCECSSGWSGSTCSVDVDECATVVNVCPSSQTCSNTNGSFVCRCPSGFTKVNVTQCVDIDECAVPTENNCAQVCTNTQGGFVCSCNSGYNYIASNNTCVDIDECSVGTDRCEQNCVNYPGSANCECREGFALDDDRRTCIKELDPCQRLSLNVTCSYGCQVVGGQASCYCQSGYQLGIDDVTCLDINECSSNTTNSCSQQCQNLPGSYQCTCTTGFTLDNDGRTCQTCDAFHWGDDCANDCNCNALSTERCDPIVGCVCKSGWLGTLCEQDRDDCQSSPCGANALCTDTDGSYRCDCQQGYAVDATPNLCQDVDECANNPCDQTCNNTVGSYVCSCSSGFTSVGDSCNDVDECISNPCDQICRNTIGGFACECNAGFVLDQNTRTTCVARTLCSSSNTCEQDCRVVGGSDECFCRAGYTQSTTNTSVCIDIDECSPSSPCVNGTCNNLPGEFNCTCASGTYLLNDLVTCQVCPEGKFGASCASTCTCNATNTATCDPVTGNCTCNTGWNGNTCNDNVDECSTSSPCAAVGNSTCQDTLGSYRCDCNVGFSTYNGLCQPCDNVNYGVECSLPCPCVFANTQDCNDVTGQCTCTQYWSGVNCTQDVNECSTVGTCQTDQYEQCRNFDGGYSCDCISGFERITPTANCTDINECLYQGLNTCNVTVENCINTPGSFNCTCKTGFFNNAGTCEDVDECSSSSLNTCNNKQTCSNTYGGYSCPCKSTYRLINGTCVDFDECLLSSTNNCTSSENCVNSEGGYSCVCRTGYNTNSNGECIPTYRNYSVVFIMDYAVTGSLSNPSSAYYSSLSGEVRSALVTFFQAIIAAFHDARITGMRAGSLIVDAEVQIDANKTDNPDGEAAKGLDALLNSGSLTINGTATPVLGVNVSDTALTSASVLCDAFLAVTTCQADERCRADSSGVPSCSPVEEDDDYKLIIGLGVGIPLFFISCVVVAVLVYMCVKRKKDTAASTHMAEPSEHRFPSIFAGQLATKGSWGAAQRYHMYSPDNVSVSHGSDSSGEGQLLKGRRHGRSDFQDSAWYDNRGASTSAASPRRDRDDQGTTDGATSNFSWEYMFRLLAPYRGGFEIQRPNVDPSPNPAYTPRTKGPRPDSMA